MMLKDNGGCFFSVYADSDCLAQQQSAADFKLCKSWDWQCMQKLVLGDY